VRVATVRRRKMTTMTVVRRLVATLLVGTTTVVAHRHHREAVPLATTMIHAMTATVHRLADRLPAMTTHLLRVTWMIDTVDHLRRVVHTPSQTHTLTDTDVSPMAVRQARAAMDLAMAVVNLLVAAVAVDMTAAMTLPDIRCTRRNVALCHL